MTNDNLKNQAYAEAMRIEKWNYPEEIVYAKLEKKGYSIEVSKAVAKNIILQRAKTKKSSLYSDFFNIGFILAAVWFLGCVAFYITTGNFNLSFTAFLSVAIPSIILGYLMSVEELKIK